MHIHSEYIQSHQLCRCCQRHLTLSKEAKLLRSSQARCRYSGLTAPFFITRVWSWRSRQKHKACVFTNKTQEH